MSGNTVLILVLGGAALVLVLALGAIQWRIGRLKRDIGVAKRWPTIPGRVVGGSIAPQRAGDLRDALYFLVRAGLDGVVDRSAHNVRAGVWSAAPTSPMSARETTLRLAAAGAGAGRR